jgi:hypothetical protein
MFRVDMEAELELGRMRQAELERAARERALLAEMGRPGRVRRGLAAGLRGLAERLEPHAAGRSASGRRTIRAMCRSIKPLRTPEGPASEEEVRAAALQFVRKVSGYQRPTAAHVEPFETAVAEVTAATERLLAVLPPRKVPYLTPRERAARAERG